MSTENQAPRESASVAYIDFRSKQVFTRNTVPVPSKDTRTVRPAAFNGPI